MSEVFEISKRTVVGLYSLLKLDPDSGLREPASYSYILSHTHSSLVRNMSRCSLGHGIGGACIHDDTQEDGRP